MELLITGANTQNKIAWNYDEVKNWAKESVAQYENMVVTEDQIGFAKEKRAELNKLTKALDDARKAEKKKCLQPYEAFEKEIKEVITIVSDATKTIDEQLKAFEAQRKLDKIIEIESVWAELEKPSDWISLEKIMPSQWLNATYAMSKIKKELAERLEQIASDIEVIRQLEEYAFEAEDAYKVNLDLSGAMREVQRLKDQAQRKAQAEAAKQEAIQAQKEQPQPKQEASSNTDIAVERSWIGFKALLSKDEAIALKEFFNAREIEFKAI